MPRTPIYDILMVTSDVLILLGALAVLAFLALYLHRFDWRSTVPGKATAYFLMSLVAVLVLSGLGRWLGPDYFGREYLRLIVYGCVAWASIRMLLALVSFYHGPVKGRVGESFLPELKPVKEQPTSETETSS